MPKLLVLVHLIFISCFAQATETQRGVVQISKERLQDIIYLNTWTNRYYSSVNITSISDYNIYHRFDSDYALDKIKSLRNNGPLVSAGGDFHISFDIAFEPRDDGYESFTFSFSCALRLVLRAGAAHLYSCVLQNDGPLVGIHELDWSFLGNPISGDPIFFERNYLYPIALFSPTQAIASSYWVPYTTDDVQERARVSNFYASGVLHYLTHNHEASGCQISEVALNDSSSDIKVLCDYGKNAAHDGYVSIHAPELHVLVSQFNTFEDYLNSLKSDSLKKPSRWSSLRWLWGELFN